ncbi:ribosomal L1 domain-containing protein 1 [Xenentodon cancila]
MADQTEFLDRAQVKKAVQALQAFLKTKASGGGGGGLFPNDTQQFNLLFTLWKIPKAAQTVRIPLPHGQRPDSEEVCLFTRDEPNMTPEQTQRFYKRLLEDRGVKGISEIIPYKVLKTEYKPYEAKRRLLGNFDMFLSDDRIRRLLPSHLGKHFYERKKEPLSVDLQSKHLARDLQRVIQGTSMKITNKGCCCMARVAHSGMTADEVTENIEATVQTVVSKMRMKGPVLKLIHLKTPTSVALPIYTSDLNHLQVLETSKNKKPEDRKTTKAAGRKKNKKKAKTVEDNNGEVKREEEEEIPQLVPIVTPSKKPKLEKSSKQKQLQFTPKPAAAKKATKAQSKRPKKTGRMDAKVKRKAPKAK